MKKLFAVVLLAFSLATCSKEEETKKDSTMQKFAKKERYETQFKTKKPLQEVVKQTEVLNLDGKAKANSWEVEVKDNDIITEIIKNDDESIVKFVNDKIPFNKINYTPRDLVPIKGDYIIDLKGNQRLRSEANKYLQELSRDFYDKFKVKLKVVSAYRSYDYQAFIKRRGCSDYFCAKPGYSEHQTGLAVDLFETTSEKEFLSKDDLKRYFEWLKENAYKYGFHNSYQKGKEVDGYDIEPWHWRYLGIPLAKKLKEKGMSYAEYYNLVIKNNTF